MSVDLPRDVHAVAGRFATVGRAGFYGGDAVVAGGASASSWAFSCHGRMSRLAAAGEGTRPVRANMGFQGVAFRCTFEAAVRNRYKWESARQECL